ncbi:MAG: hypothetical protein KAI72_04780 [Candidatus Pacebacteria bacterium]|nr:hypothetical protein [Candidatus Paceibacterota bacterium]
MNQNNQNRDNIDRNNGNVNNFVPKQKQNPVNFTVKAIGKKKMEWKEFVQKTKHDWANFKMSVRSFIKTSKKVFRFVMVFYVIASAVITATVLNNLSDYVYTYKNSGEIEVLRKADPEAKTKMLDAYKRVESRTEEIKQEEIEKQFNQVSEKTDTPQKAAISLVKTAYAEETNSASVVRTVTAYNLVPEQTDNTPCIGTANQNLCYLMRTKKMNVCASSAYKFGTIIKIPGYLGSQKNGDNTCVVLDRMAGKHDGKVDISMDQDIPRAFDLGTQNLPITVVGYMEDWSKLAPATIFTEPSR